MSKYVCGSLKKIKYPSLKIGQPMYLTHAGQVNKLHSTLAGELRRLYANLWGFVDVRSRSEYSRPSNGRCHTCN